jgi:hypothetical protein
MKRVDKTASEEEL